jgi:mycofactocin glycosyltransferase
MDSSFAPNAAGPRSPCYEPDVSVIVPAYNVEDTIQDCVSSLLALRYPRARRELIVVDNASTDGTRLILERYAGEITLLSERRPGPAAARNRGLRAARGEVVAFTDSDCVVDGEWLRQVVAPLQDPAVGLVGGKILARPPCNAIARFGEDIHDQNKAINVYRPPYVAGGNLAARRGLLEELNLLDERQRWYDDVDLSYRAVQAGYRLVYAPRAVVYHKNEERIGGLFGQGLRHGFYSIKTQKTHDRFLRRFGHRRFQARAYLDIVRRLVDCFLGRNRTEALCYVAFNSGKRIGKIFGSVRYRHFGV